MPEVKIEDLIESVERVWDEIRNQKEVLEKQNELLESLIEAVNAQGQQICSSIMIWSGDDNKLG